MISKYRREGRKDRKKPKPDNFSYSGREIKRGKVPLASDLVPLWVGLTGFQISTVGRSAGLALGEPGRTEHARQGTCQGANLIFVTQHPSSLALGTEP